MKINKRVYQYIKWGIIGAFVIVTGIIGIVGLSHLGDEKAPDTPSNTISPQIFSSPSQDQSMINDSFTPIISTTNNIFGGPFGILFFVAITFMVWKFIRG